MTTGGRLSKPLALLLLIGLTLAACTVGAAQVPAQVPTQVPTQVDPLVPTLDSARPTREATFPSPTRSMNGQQSYPEGESWRFGVGIADQA
ncbi:MAG: hypothetical protein WBR18_12655, partial [Anaerolineales bacterium]